MERQTIVYFTLHQFNQFLKPFMLLVTHIVKIGVKLISLIMYSYTIIHQYEPLWCHFSFNCLVPRNLKQCFFLALVFELFGSSFHCHAFFHTIWFLPSIHLQACPYLINAGKKLYLPIWCCMSICNSSTFLKVDLSLVSLMSSRSILITRLRWTNGPFPPSIGVIWVDLSIGGHY